LLGLSLLPWKMALRKLRSALSNSTKSVKGRRSRSGGSIVLTIFVDEISAMSGERSE
jgi:hypothetical protein